MGIEERIKKVRKDNGLNQADFGKSLGVSRNVIKTYELSLVKPSEIFIDHLCVVYGINPEWIETGEGCMLADTSREEQIARFVGEAMKEEGSFKHALITLLSELDEDGWQKLADAAHALLDAQEQSRKKGDP